ncbi:AAA family ATPase [Actinoplanes sp. NPDC023714]|uniref:AAA family ATPase n=1 Tax=Actinoplanes sp. NPDC023714 TaxID=3154322 RepID=UPI0033EE638C
MTDEPLDAELRAILPPRARLLLDVWCQRSRRIRLERALTDGRTPAVVAVVVVEKWDGRAPVRMILKFLPERKRTRLEYDTFARAVDEAPASFRQHLVRLHGDRPVAVDANSTIIFMEYALIGRYKPIAVTTLLRNAALGEACETVVRSILLEWNDLDRWSAPVIPADDFLREVASWTCQPGGPLYRWLQREEPGLLDQDRRSLPGGLPNPVHLARSGDALADLEIRAFRGRSHGDLHTDNILIPKADDPRFADFRLIDFSTYRDDGLLAFDPAYLICSILAHRIGRLPDDGGPLIELMLGGDGGRSADFPHDVREAVFRIAGACRESALARGWNEDEWDPNLLLALTGTALIYAGRNLATGVEARRWFLRFAAHAAAAALDRLRARSSGARVERPAHWERLIEEPGLRVLVLAGPEGIGKTHAVRRRLEALRAAAGDDLVVRTIDVHAGSTFGAADLVAALEEEAGPDRAAVPRASGRESDLLLGRLDALLDRLGDRRVVLVLDPVDPLIDASWTLRDVYLDEALRLLATRPGHEVSVLLVCRRDPAPDRRDWLAAAEVHSVGKGMPVDELKRFYAAFDRNGAYHTAGTGDEVWRELHDRTGGNPRAGEMAFALLDFAESGFASLRDVAALLADVQSGNAVDVLFRAVLRGLTELQRRILLALAVYRIPVDAAAVHAVVGDPYTAGSVGDALRKLAARNVIRFDADRFYLRNPDDERVIGHLGDDGVRRGFGKRAEAYLATLSQGPVERLRDLWPHRARIDILLECGEYKDAGRLMNDVERCLSKWGYGWLLIDQRERVNRHLGKRLRFTNLDWLAKEYTDVARLDRAEECYAEAAALVDWENDWPGPKRLLTNLAGVQFLRGKLDEAFRSYRGALGMARLAYDPVEEIAPLEGLADCHRRRGGFAIGHVLLERALRLAEQSDLGTVHLRLKLARRDVERGLYRSAVQRLRLVEDVVDENADPATACHLYDIDADLRLALGRVDLARVQARRAVHLAGEVGDARVFVQARSTLAAIHLHEGRLDEARKAIEAADRRRLEGESLLVLGMQAVVWHLLRDPGAADAFARLRDEADVRRDRDERDFGAWDFEGLAICGLFLHGREDLAPALAAFGASRDICRPEWLVGRLEELLTHLDEGTGRLAPAIAAATRA